MGSEPVKASESGTLHRYPDWPRRLSAYVSERRSLPYAYGSNDCGSFVIDGIAAMTGADLLPNVVRPVSAIGAQRFLIVNGYCDVEGLMTALLGDRLPSPKVAQRGDVVSFESGGETHLALVVSSAAATPGRDGLLWVPRALWRAGWKVG